MKKCYYLIVDVTSIAHIFKNVVYLKTVMIGLATNRHYKFFKKEIKTMFNSNFTTLGYGLTTTGLYYAVLLTYSKVNNELA